MLNSLQNTKTTTTAGTASAGGDSHKSIALAETQNPPKRKLLQPDSFNEVKLAEEFREKVGRPMDDFLFLSRVESSLREFEICKRHFLASENDVGTSE